MTNEVPYIAKLTTLQASPLRAAETTKIVKAAVASAAPIPWVILLAISSPSDCFGKA